MSAKVVAFSLCTSTNRMARKRSRNSSGGGKKAAPGATINKIESYEDTLEEGGVDDCESATHSS